MNLFDQLTEKPWETAQGGVVDRRHGRAFSLPLATLGLRVLMTVITVLFSLLVIVYSDRMTFGDWRPLPDPWVLWLNTALLISSSAAWHWASISARRGRMDGVKVGLFGASSFAFAFLAGQLWAWQQLAAMGYFAATNPANGFFYLITGLHGVHLLGGLVAWGRTADKVWSGDFEPAQVRLSVELCAAYWHFLLVVWLVLFGLLLLT